MDEKNIDGVIRVAEKYQKIMIEKDKEIEQLKETMKFWSGRAKKLADDKIKLRDLLSREIEGEIEELLEKIKRKKI